MLKSLLLVVWMGGHGMKLRQLPLPWFSGLAILLELVETTGVWPQGLLDAFFAMISKVDGDSTPPGQTASQRAPGCVQAVGFFSVGHLREWVEGWLPESVYRFGYGLS